MDIRLDQVNLVVGDMEAMAAFYGRLGVDLGDPRSRWAADHRSPADPTEAGGAVLELDSQASAAVWSPNLAGGPGVVLGFRVGDRAAVDRLYEQLVGLGHEGVTEPHDAFWGARYAVVRDPDGNAVGLMSPQDDAYRSTPPPPLA